MSLIFPVLALLMLVPERCTLTLAKWFVIRSTALVSLALFGAFASRAEIKTVDVLTPKVFIGFILVAMLPYWFSAMITKSVGSATLKMVEEARKQYNIIPGLMEGTVKPDYATCVKISTDASLREIIPPGALAILSPLIPGTFFGVKTVIGSLAGALVSGVQELISQELNLPFINLPIPGAQPQFWN